MNSAAKIEKVEIVRFSDVFHKNRGPDVGILGRRKKLTSSGSTGWL